MALTNWKSALLNIVAENGWLKMNALHIIYIFFLCFFLFACYEYNQGNEINEFIRRAVIISIYNSKYFQTIILHLENPRILAKLLNQFSCLVEITCHGKHTEENVHTN